MLPRCGISSQCNPAALKIANPGPRYPRAGVADVVDHDTADPLQTNKRIDLAINAGNLKCFRLRALVIRTVVTAILIVGGIKISPQTLGRDNLEVTATVEDQLAGAAIPDTERPGTVNIEFLIYATVGCR